VALAATRVPPWHTVYDQTKRRLAASSFNATAQDLRALLRLVDVREAQPSAVIFDARTLRSPESGERAHYNGRKRGSETHAPVDALRHHIWL
jgi:hypothetical protein